MEPKISELFTRQKEEFDSILDKLTGVDNISESQVENFFQDFNEELSDILQEGASPIARRFYDFIVIQERNFDEAAELLLQERIASTIADQGETLLISGLINKTTADAIIEQLKESKLKNETVKELKERIMDVDPYFNESSKDAIKRTNAIARTEAGTYSSIGQLTAGEDSGAEMKGWMTSGSNVRQKHTNREGEYVPIGESFSNQGFLSAPRYPCDPLAAASDRINCRCSLVFSMR